MTTNSITTECGECSKRYKVTAHTTADGRGYFLRCGKPRSGCYACPAAGEPIWDGDNDNLDMTPPTAAELVEALRSRRRELVPA
jgi:hypothetical protein